MPLRTLTEEEKEAVARLVWAEARGESAQGRRAVADVVLNRILASEFPDDPIRVIEQGAGARGAQFSPLRNRTSYTDLRRPPAAVRRAISQHIDGRVAGTSRDETGGATFFQNLAASRRIIPEPDETVTIGRHTFGTRVSGGTPVRVAGAVQQRPRAKPGQRATGTGVAGARAAGVAAMGPAALGTSRLAAGELEGLTADARAALGEARRAAGAAGLARLEMTGGRARTGHRSHYAGTEVDVTGFNADGTRWSRDQRLRVAEAAASAGANRFGLYGSEARVGALHFGFGPGGRNRNTAWGPGGRTSGVDLADFPEAEQAFVTTVRSGEFAAGAEAVSDFATPRAKPAPPSARLAERATAVPGFATPRPKPERGQIAVETALSPYERAVRAGTREAFVAENQRRIEAEFALRRGETRRRIEAEFDEAIRASDDFSFGEPGLVRGGDRGVQRPSGPGRPGKEDALTMGFAFGRGTEESGGIPAPRPFDEIVIEGGLRRADLSRGPAPAALALAPAPPATLSPERAASLAAAARAAVSAQQRIAAGRAPAHAAGQRIEGQRIESRLMELAATRIGRGREIAAASGVFGTEERSPAAAPAAPVVSGSGSGAGSAGAGASASATAALRLVPAVAPEVVPPGLPARMAPAPPVPRVRIMRQEPARPVEPVRAERNADPIGGLIRALFGLGGPDREPARDRDRQATTPARRDDRTQSLRDYARAHARHVHGRDRAPVQSSRR